MERRYDWGKLSQRGYLASGIDPGDRKGHKNTYIDLLQKTALEEVLELKGDERVLDFGCGSGRISYWIAPRVKEVIGLELTPGMIELAEKNRKAENVKFMLYDGVHFPALPGPLDIGLSVGVLQILKGEMLKRTVSELTQYLRKGGRFCFIEQVSDNPKVGRPGVAEYLDAFKKSNLECLRHYPIRSGRGWMLYLIRYGFVPRGSFAKIARNEISRLRENRAPIFYYSDYLFVLRKS